MIIEEQDEEDGRGKLMNIKWREGVVAAKVPGGYLGGCQHREVACSYSTKFGEKDTIHWILRFL